MFTKKSLCYTTLALTSSIGFSSDPFFFQSPTFEGSGCPSDSVQIITASDFQTVSVLFSEYSAATSSKSTFDRKSCNLAVPVDIAPGYSMGIVKVDYRGYVFAPKKSSEADFMAEYFFAGIKGPVVKEEYTKYQDDIYVSNDVGIASVVWSDCGSSTIFRINTSIMARKDSSDDEDVFITIDTTDMTVTNAFTYYVTTKKC